MNPDIVIPGRFFAWFGVFGPLRWKNDHYFENWPWAKFFIQDGRQNGATGPLIINNSKTIGHSTMVLVSRGRFWGPRNMIMSTKLFCYEHMCWYPRWPPKWSPRPLISHNSKTTRHRIMFLVSKSRFQGPRNMIRSATLFYNEHVCSKSKMADILDYPRHRYTPFWILFHSTWSFMCLWICFWSWKVLWRYVDWLIANTKLTKWNNQS